MAYWRKCVAAGDREGPSRSGYVRSVRRRLPGVVGVWAGLGVTAGLLTAPPNGAIGLVAGVIAGLIVYPPLGVLLTLAGARWKETLCGGLAGLFAAGMGVVVGELPNGPQLVATGLTAGGLAGGTLLTVAVRLPRLILARVRATLRSWLDARRPVGR